MREYKKNGIKIKSFATNIWRVLIVAIWFLPMTVFADGTDRFYVDITILENGDITVKEAISLEGEYNGSYREIEYQNPYATKFTGIYANFAGTTDIYNGTGIKDIKIYRIPKSSFHSISDMTRIQNEFRKVNSADNGDRFVYTEESITAGVYLKMFMPSSEDSVFYIEYTIEDAVVIHNDVAELYWNVLESGYTEDIEDFQVLIHLPGENKIIDTRTVSFTDYDVDSYTAETIRLMFAKSLVPSGTKVSNVDGRDYILQYEQQMAAAANAYREQARIELINEASQTVLDLEENQTMYYYNRALEAVNSLPDVTEKADFLARIEALKDVVNENWIKDLDANIKWFREYPSNYDLEMIKEQIEEGFDEEKKQEYYAMMPELEDILFRHNVKDLIQSTIILFIPLVIILAFGIRALIHNRKDRNAFGQKYFRDFPSEDTPGAIEYLTLNKVTTNSVSATILDLIRRKIIKAEEIPGKKKNSKDTELTLIDTNYHGTPEENLLIKLLFTIVGKDHKCTLKELQDYGTRSEAKARRIRSTINTFTEESKEEMEKKGYVEKANVKSCLATTGVIIVAFFEFMFIFYALRNFSNGWLYLIYFGLLFAIIIFYFTEVSNSVKRSEEGRLLYSKWLAHRAFLNDFGRFPEKELPEIHLWEKYLVTATIFGIADKVKKQMELKVADFDTDTMYVWNNYMLSYSIARSINRSVSSSLSQANSTISRAQAASSSYSSGGGFGGGSSFGGGGGGGGSGRGGRG